MGRLSGFDGHIVHLLMVCGAAEEPVFASDFYIVQVEGGDWKKAARFLVQESLWTKLGQPFWVNREQLVRTLDEGYIVEVMAKKAENTLGRRVLLIGLDEEPHFCLEGANGNGKKSSLAAGSSRVSVSTT